MAGQQLFEAIERVYHTGVVHVADEWRIQMLVDGAGVPQDRYISFTASPCRASDDRSGDDTVIGVNVSVLDVTDSA